MKALIVLLCVIMVAILLFPALCYTPRYEPEEGIWFCEELQIQLEYPEEHAFIIEDGERIQCCCGSDRGMKEIQVYCDEWEHPKYHHDELLFRAEIKKLTDATMIVSDLLTEQEYIFVRTDIAK